MPLIRLPARLPHATRARLARADRAPGAGATASAARGVRPVQRLGRALLLLAVLGLAGCGGSGVPCRFSDMDDQMMSTRTAFLERMTGCPIGGYN